MAPRKNAKKPLKPVNKVIKKYVDKRIKSTCEPKHVYLSVDSNAISDATAYPQLSGIPQGTGDMQKLGECVTFRSIEIGFNMSLRGASTSSTIRMFLFQWNQVNTTSPTDATVFEDYGTTLGKLVNTFTRDTKHQRCLRIIKDWTIKLNSNNPSMYFRRKINLSRCAKLYGVGGSTTAQKGGLYLGYFSDIAAGANSPVFQYGYNIDYIDP